MTVKSFHFHSCNFCFIDLRISKNLISFLNGHCSYVNISDFDHVFYEDVFDYLITYILFIRIYFVPTSENFKLLDIFCSWINRALSWHSLSTFSTSISPSSLALLSP